MIPLLTRAHFLAALAMFGCSGAEPSNPADKNVPTTASQPPSSPSNTSAETEAPDPSTPSETGSSTDAATSSGTATATDSATSSIPTDSYTVCRCCCRMDDPPKQCLYRSKGDDLQKIIDEDKKKPLSKCPPNAGCTQPRKYVYCD